MEELWKWLPEGWTNQVADAQHLWTTCQASLQTQVSEAVWRSTFQDITAIDLDASVLVLSVPNAVVKDRVENRYLSLVEDIARDVAGESLRIELIVQPDAAEPTLHTPTRCGHDEPPLSTRTSNIALTISRLVQTIQFACSAPARNSQGRLPLGILSSLRASDGMGVHREVNDSPAPGSTGKASRRTVSWATRNRAQPPQRSGPHGARP